MLSSIPDVRDVNQLGGVASVPMLVTDIYKSSIEFWYRQDFGTKETISMYMIAHPRNSRSLLDLGWPTIIFSDSFFLRNIFSPRLIGLMVSLMDVIHYVKRSLSGQTAGRLDWRQPVKSME